jgi:hypothetical protein
VKGRKSINGLTLAEPAFAGINPRKKVILPYPHMRRAKS